MDKILSDFVRTAREVIELKAHGCPTKSALKGLNEDPVGCINRFYDYYTETADKFKKRDPTLISGTFWMRSTSDKKKTWNLLEKCRDLCLRYHMY